MADKFELIIETLSAKEQVKDLLNSINKLSKGLAGLQKAMPDTLVNQLKATTKAVNSTAASFDSLRASVKTLNQINVTAFSDRALGASAGVKTLANSFADMGESLRSFKRVSSSLDSSKIKEFTTGLHELFKGKAKTSFRKDLAQIKEMSSTFSKLSRGVTSLNNISFNEKSVKGFLSDFTDSFKNNKEALNQAHVFASILGKIGTSLRSLSKVSFDPKSFRNLNKVMDAYLTRAAALVEKHKSTIISLKTFATSLATVSNSAKKLETSLNKVKNVTGDVSSSSRKAVSSLNLFAGGIRSVITSFIGGTVIYRTVSTIKEAVVSFAELESTMRQVNTIARLGAEGLSYMREEVLRLSGAYGISSPELATALYEINSATIVGIDSLKVLEQSARQAVAGYTDVTSSAVLISKIIMAYGYEVKKSEHITNVLFKTVERGINTMESLNKDFGKILSTGRSAGVSFEESAAALATLTSRGLQTNIAVTALNAAYMKLSSGNKKLNAVFRELGFASSAAALRAKGLAYVMEVLSKVTGNSMEQLRYLGFDYRDVRATTILAREATTGFAENLRYIADPAQTAGATLKALEQVQMSMKQQFAELNMSIKSFSASMYGAVESSTAIRDVLTSLKNIFNDLSNYGNLLGSILIGSLPLIATVLLSRLKSISLLIDVINNKLDKTSGNLAKTHRYLRRFGGGKVASSISGNLAGGFAFLKGVFAKLFSFVKRSLLSLKSLFSLKTLKSIFSLESLKNVLAAAIRKLGPFLGKLLVSGVSKFLLGPAGWIILAYDIAKLLQSWIDSYSNDSETIKKNVGAVDLIQARIIAYEKEFAKLKKLTKGTDEYANQLAKVSGMRNALNNLVDSSGITSLLPLMKKINDRAKEPEVDAVDPEYLEKVARAWEAVREAQRDAMQAGAGDFVKALTALNKYKDAQKDLDSYLSKRNMRTGYAENDTLSRIVEFNEILDKDSIKGALDYLSKFLKKLPDEVASKYTDFSRGILDPSVIKEFFRDYEVYIASADDLAVAELEKLIVSSKAAFDAAKKSILDFIEKLKQDYTNMWLDSLPSSERYQELLKIRSEYLKQFNSAISEGTAQSLERAAALLPKLNSIRNKLAEIRPTANQSERVTAIEAISSGTKEAVEFILNAMNTDYSKDTARNTKEISQYTREQMRDTKRLYDALNKLSIAT